MNFFKTFLACLLAIIVSGMLMGMLWVMVLVGMMASFSSSTPSVGTGSVLRLNIHTVTDSPSASPFDNFDFFSMTRSSRTTLLKTISAINAAASDDRIEGIYINFDEYANVSLSSLEEIRAALTDFKESGKFIVAYNENYGQVGYYLSSVADKVYMNPEGSFDWRGMSVRTMFYKGLLEKLDLEPVIIRHGTFKAAVEPFMYDRMSPENRLQNQTVANSIWEGIVEAISVSRGIPGQNLQAWANSLAIDSPRAALAHGLIDGLRYEDEVRAELVSRVDGSWTGAATEPAAVEDSPAETWVSSDEVAVEEVAAETPAKKKSKRSSGSDLKVVSFSDYVAQAATGTKLSKNKIALIYAEGSIVSGEGARGEIGSVTAARKLANARKDPNVKAVVFRVNSPGGSALASEVMWRELELLKKEVPVIVSMGDYAASGGYYISCPADVIYANRSTITGSIGVYGLYVNAGKTMKDKLGVTVDAVNTNEYSDITSMYRSPAPAEMRYFQKSVEDVYTTFVNHVADGRNMTFEAVDKIGEGRIWSGADAVGIGLVDGIGGIYDAIAIAADRAGIADDFRIWEVVDEQTGFASLLGSAAASIRQARQTDAMGDAFVHYNNLMMMLREEGVQARMPYVLEFE